jgi:hypothetical protein
MGGTHETYEPPHVTADATLASIIGEQYGDQGYKYMNMPIGEADACLTHIDNKDVVSGDDCRSFTTHTYRVAAGRHTVRVYYWINIGTFLGQHMHPKGWRADIPVSMEPGQSYIVHAKRSGISRVSLWVTTKDGVSASPVFERYTDMVGHAVFESGGEQKAPEKHRVFVYMDSSANYGSNDSRFRDQFLALAERCQVKAEFYAAPRRGGALELNDRVPDLSEAKARIAKFAPDGILTLGATKQTWFSRPGSEVPDAGSFYFNAVLTKGDDGPPEWSATLWHYASSVGGGEQLADGVVGRFSELGIFPHCPDLNIHY